MPRLIARPLSERIRLYAKAIELQKAGLSYGQISKEIGVNRASVYDWLARHNSPKREAFFPNLSYSTDAAYLIGFYLGDGRSAGVEKHIRFSLVDLQQAQSINQVMARILRTLPRDLTLEHGYFRPQFTNAILYDFLHQPLQKLQRWIDPYPSMFLRGIYDAEGYVSPAINSQSKELVSFVIGLVNTNVELLRLAETLLAHLGIDGKMRQTNLAGQEMTIRGKTYFRRKTVHHFLIHRSEARTRFATSVGFATNTKQRKLMDLASLFETYADSTERYDRFVNLYTKIGRRWIRRKMK